MNVYEAWIRAGVGKKIRSGITVLDVTNPGKRAIIPITTGLIQALSQDDWEVVREKHKLEFIGVDFSGVIGDETVSDIFDDKGLKKPTIYTKITLEWEE